MGLAKRALELPRKSTERKRIEAFIGSLSDESIRECRESSHDFQFGKSVSVDADARQVAVSSGGEPEDRCVP